MEDRKFSGLSLTVIALLLVAIVGTGVYAYYASSATGTANVRALKYAFQVEGGDTLTTDGQTFEIELTPNTIQPGTQVAIPVKVSATGSDVDVDYTIAVKYANGSEKIENLDICLVSSANGECASPLAINDFSGEYVQVASGRLTAGAGETTKTFYVTWPYGNEGSHLVDNPDMDKTVTLSIEVKGQQKNPNAA